MVEDRKNNWSIIGAIALIVIGVWMLLGRIGGPWWDVINGAFRFLMTIAWPLALIAGGVMLLIAGRKGTFGSVDVRGKRLYRSRTDRMVAGVLGGVASYLGMDSTWVRIAFVILTVLTSLPGILVYIIAAIVLPEEPKATPEAPAWPTTGTGTSESVQTPAPPTPPAPPSPRPNPPAPAVPAPPAPPAPPLDRK